MQRQIDAGHIQGAVTAVARRGKLVHFETHGLMDIEAERPMAPDALFIMMSSTKPVLGVAAMMVIEEGLIRPSDPVSEYIPEFADPQVAVLKEPADEDVIPKRIDWQNIPEHRLVPAETEITIQHLLTHTSGLASGGLGSAAAYGQEPERDTLAGYVPKLGAVALDFHPGTRWAYSGAHGLDVVARIIEIVSDMPYQDFRADAHSRSLADARHALQPAAGEGTAAGGYQGSGPLALDRRDDVLLRFLRAHEHGEGLSPFPADAGQRRRTSSASGCSVRAPWRCLAATTSAVCTAAWAATRAGWATATPSPWCWTPSPPTAAGVPAHSAGRAHSARCPGLTLPRKSRPSSWCSSTTRRPPRLRERDSAGDHRLTGFGVRGDCRRRSEFVFGLPGRADGTAHRR